METKVCSRCNLEKQINEFHISKTNRSGYSSACKKCIALSVDHDKKLINDEKYRNSHREELREKARIKNKEHPEEKHNRYIRYYEKNKEKIKNKTKNWRKQNTEFYLIYSKKYHSINHDRISNQKRSVKLLKAYGITVKEYDDLYNSQNGVCAICGKQEMAIHNKTNKPRRLAIDHNHTTGKVRGLLCGSCNTALGKFNDNIDTLKIAINYLETHK